jgi:hypothetical protein
VNFRDELESACAQIKQLGHLDHIHCHHTEPDYILNDSRFQRHLQYRVNISDDSSLGNGYWFYKAIVIRHYMDIYSNNDYIIWFDLESIQRFEPLRFHKIIETLHRRAADFVYDIAPFKESDYTKEDMFVAFNSTEIIRSTPQINAAFQVIRVSEKTRRYYDAIIDCNADYHMISDELSTLPNKPNFIRGNHDQSILSLFYKTYLSNQIVIGPRAQPIYNSSHLYTFKLDNSTNVKCPFADFYRTRTKE